MLIRFENDISEQPFHAWDEMNKSDQVKRNVMNFFGLE